MVRVGLERIPPSAHRKREQTCAKFSVKTDAQRSSAQPGNGAPVGCLVQQNVQVGSVQKSLKGSKENSISENLPRLARGAGFP